MLTDKEIKFLRDELLTAKNPLFFYDGDGDGLASFLLLYKINREGKGIALTNSKSLDSVGVRKVKELEPDKIFILDVPEVSQEFIDKVKRPVFWLDHHNPLKRTKVHYFNPQIKNKGVYIPTSVMAWDVSNRPEDLWIATIGCLADYYIPDFLKKFIKEHLSFINKKEDLPTMLFKREVGKLVKLFFFILKGKAGDVRKSVKILTRIKSPEEIFEEQTPQGKFIYKRFLKLNSQYESLLKRAKKKVTRSKIVLFFYTDDKSSFTTNLANELAGLYPDKFIIIARRKSGEMKCSLRGKNILPIIKKALRGVKGRGGGHPDACGAVIKEEDWELFLENFKENLK